MLYVLNNNFGWQSVYRSRLLFIVVNEDTLHRKPDELKIENHDVQTMKGTQLVIFRTMHMWRSVL